MGNLSSVHNEKLAYEQSKGLLEGLQSINQTPMALMCRISHRNAQLLF